jgi:LAO/AO transport system kinase
VGRRRAHRIGVTGPPGVGKSTLIGGLVRLYRERGERVAVVACDPASPVTGGAFLGDRMRMAGAGEADPGVFIRSVASRGPGAELPPEALAAAEVLESAGFPRVILETPGAGQCDVGLGRMVDTALVVLSPDSGDEYQVLKAGLIETADVLVVNRADRPGAEWLVRALEDEVAARAGGRRPRVVATVATRGDGLPVLLEAIEAHRAQHTQEAKP